MLRSYLKFLLKSKNEHALHSPFVYDLFTKVIKSKNKFEDFEVIENYRKSLLNNETKINIVDLGAGSKIHKNKTRKIKEIAKSAEKSPKFGQLIYKMIRHFEPDTIIDLGTSLGITTLYEQKAAKKTSKIFTFEGCPETSNIAKQLFEKTKANNIEIIEGNIDNTLPEVLKAINRIDFAFFDANHRYEPTIRYFEQCLEKANEQSVFVFDDIHWSPEMEHAWEFIKANSQVMISIDLFFVGLVFFRKNQPKQHYLLRF